MDSEKGVVFVVSGPSGTGKGTILSKLKETFPKIAYSVSATTREPREGEVEGKHYFFKSREQFQKMIQDEDLLEWVEYCNNYYGTPKTSVMEKISLGEDILIEVEVKGAIHLKRNYPESVLVFIMPPSFQELKERIFKRGSETEKAMAMRLKIALNEVQASEKYDYIIVNDDLDEAIKDLNAILVAEKLKSNRKKSLIDSILKEGLAYERK